MKNLKKIFAICIAAQLAAASITAQAFEAEPISESTADIRINAFLEQYFKKGKVILMIQSCPQFKK